MRKNTSDVKSRYFNDLSIIIRQIKIEILKARSYMQKKKKNWKKHRKMQLNTFGSKINYKSSKNNIL